MAKEHRRANLPWSWPFKRKAPRWHFRLLFRIVISFAGRAIAAKRPGEETLRRRFTAAVRFEIWNSIYSFIVCYLFFWWLATSLKLCTRRNGASLPWYQNGGVSWPLSLERYSGCKAIEKKLRNGIARSNERKCYYSGTWSYTSCNVFSIIFVNATTSSPYLPCTHQTYRLFRWSSWLGHLCPYSGASPHCGCNLRLAGSQAAFQLVNCYSLGVWQRKYVKPTHRVALARLCNLHHWYPGLEACACRYHSLTTNPSDAKFIIFSCYTEHDLLCKVGTTSVMLLFSAWGLLQR